MAELIKSYGFDCSLNYSLLNYGFPDLRKTGDVKKMAEKQKTEEKTKPVHNIRAGSVKASIWENKTDKGSFFSVSIQRSYKDADGQWQNSDSYPLNDLQKLALVAQKSFEWILIERKSEEQ